MNLTIDGNHGHATIREFADRLSGNRGYTVSLYGPRPSRDFFACQTFSEFNTITPLGLTGVWLQARAFAQSWAQDGEY